MCTHSFLPLEVYAFKFLSKFQKNIFKNRRFSKKVEYQLKSNLIPNVCHTWNFIFYPSSIIESTKYNISFTHGTYIFQNQINIFGSQNQFSNHLLLTRLPASDFERSLWLWSIFRQYQNFNGMLFYRSRIIFVAC